MVGWSSKHPPAGRQTQRTQHTCLLSPLLSLKPVIETPTSRPDRPSVPSIPVYCLLYSPSNRSSKHPPAGPTDPAYPAYLPNPHAYSGHITWATSTLSASGVRAR
ncbi:hypothetical protein N7524_009236 [Penicillium chrysogenum]|nr:hypothetical protein N7524_009236 [Penicillium chrysogenum]